jgi:hypothetical protein
MVLRFFFILILYEIFKLSSQFPMTNFMKHDPSWEAYSRSVKHVIRRISHYSCLQESACGPYPVHVNSFYTLTIYFFEIPCNMPLAPPYLYQEIQNSLLPPIIRTKSCIIIPVSHKTYNEMNVSR